MLDNLLNNLKSIENEVNDESINQLSVEERAALLHDIANRVLKTLDNATKEISKQHPDDSGIEIPTSEI